MTLSEIGPQGGQKYKYAPCPFCGGQPNLLTFEDSPDFLCCENGHNTVCMEPGEWQRRAGERTPVEDAVLRAAVRWHAWATNKDRSQCGTALLQNVRDAVDALLAVKPVWGGEAKPDGK